MPSTYKRFVWRAIRLVNTVDCMNEGDIFLKKEIYQLYLQLAIQSRLFQDIWPTIQPLVHTAHECETCLY